MPSLSNLHYGQTRDQKCWKYTFSFWWLCYFINWTFCSIGLKFIGLNNKYTTYTFLFAKFWLNPHFVKYFCSKLNKGKLRLCNWHFTWVYVRFLLLFPLFKSYNITVIMRLWVCALNTHHTRTLFFAISLRHRPTGWVDYTYVFL